MEEFCNVVKSMAYALFVYLGIETGIIEALFWLMVTDSVLGIAKSLRLGRKFSFYRLAWGIVGKISLLVVPMILALIGKGVSFDFHYFVVAVLNILVVSEGISCITNVLSIKKCEEVKNTDYVTTLLMAIKNGLGTIVKKLFAVVQSGNIQDK